MQVNIVNTYACKHATPISKPVSANTIAKGIVEATVKIPPTLSIVHAKPLNIFTKVCPAIILAKRRTPKLIALKQ